jgi:hypothetical protein
MSFMGQKYLDPSLSLLMFINGLHDIHQVINKGMRIFLTIKKINVSVKILWLCYTGSIICGY